MDVIGANESQKSVPFPGQQGNTDQPVQIACETSVVVVGANGAGKSRIGAWLEFSSPVKHLVHRVTAQRSLKFPANTRPTSSQSAREAFYWAERPSSWDDDAYERGKEQLRLHHRYGTPGPGIETAPIDDFEKLLTLLFSDNYNTLLDYEEAQRRSSQKIDIPDSILRKLIGLWEQVLPHRKLRIASAEIRAASISSTTGDYSARVMSDGERVAFYLIGQCLCAQPNSIIVIDEPEIHLHKAIQDRLWNSIEAARADCTFVYLTHDLAFATSRRGATKIWARGYDNGAYDWFQVPKQEDLPEEVYLEVLGSRKPVIFVEGTRESIDTMLYEIAYPDFTIKPVGGCSAVLSATKAFNNVSDLHRLQSFGIVDRDYLEAGQIAAYQRARVHVPTVAEVENLFLLPEVLRAVAEQLLLPDAADCVNRAITMIVDDFGRAVTEHAMAVTRHKVTLQLGRFSSDAHDLDTFNSELSQFLSEVNPTAIFQAALEEAQQLASERDYTKILAVYNKKDLVLRIDGAFQIYRGTYVEKVFAMAQQGKGDIPGKLARYLPHLALS